MSSGRKTFTATRIQDALGNLLSAGSLTVQVTDANDKPIACTAGGDDGGLVTGVDAALPVVNGAIPSGSKILDTTQTLPANVCLRITVKDADDIPIRTLTKVQTPDSSFNLDTYQPNNAGQIPVQLGPPGAAATITSVSVTSLAAGATPTVTAGGTPSARTFAFGIPVGGVSTAALSADLAYQNSVNLPAIRNLYVDPTFYGGVVTPDGTLYHGYDGPYTSGGYGHFKFNVLGLTSIISPFQMGSNSASGTSAGAFYDFDGGFISSISSQTNHVAVSVPANAATFLMTTRRDDGGLPYDLSTYMMISGNTLPTRYVSSQLVDQGALAVTDAAAAAVKVGAQPFAGPVSNIWGTGDSISAGGYFSPSLAATVGVASFGPTMGGGGQQMYQAFSQAVAAHASNPTGPSIVQLVATSIAAAKVIIVEFGTNDGSTGIGSSTDSPSPTGTSTTFFGDCKMVAETLEAAIALNAPAVRPLIVVVTPYFQSRITGATLDNIIATEIAVFSGVYGYAVLNWAATSGINPTNWSTTLLDTVHPNTTGGTMLGSVLGAFINAHGASGARTPGAVLRPAPLALTDAGTIAINWASADWQYVTLGGNRTLSFSGMTAGGKYVLGLKQDSTGSRTVTWPTGIKWQGGTTPTLTTAAGKTDLFSLLYDGTNLYAMAAVNF